MAKEQKKGVIISVDDVHLDRVHEVADKLRAKGLEVQHVLEATGTITGACPAKGLASLKKVPGVAAIEEAQTVQLPPPESDVQ